jgi:hypothetical protein
LDIRVHGQKNIHGVKLDNNKTVEGTAANIMRWRCHVDTMGEDKWQME